MLVDGLVDKIIMIKNESFCCLIKINIQKKVIKGISDYLKKLKCATMITVTKNALIV